MHIFYRNSGPIKADDVDILIRDLNRNDFDVVILIESFKNFSVEFEFPESDKYSVIQDLGKNINVTIFVKKSLKFTVHKIDAFGISFIIGEYFFYAFYRSRNSSLSTAAKNELINHFVTSFQGAIRANISHQLSFIGIGDINVLIEYNAKGVATKREIGERSFPVSKYHELKRSLDQNSLLQRNSFENSAGNKIDVLFIEKKLLKKSKVNVRKVDVNTPEMILAEKHDRFHDSFVYEIDEP